MHIHFHLLFVCLRYLFLSRKLLDPFRMNNVGDVGTVGSELFPHYKMQIVPLILILRVLKSSAADGSVSRDYVATKEAS